MSAALDAVTRLDYTTPLPEDAAVLAVFERHCQKGAFVWPEPTVACLICGNPDGPECGSCTAEWDQRIDRASDQ